MNRINVSEIHEQVWFPKNLRDHVTDALQSILNWGNIYRPVAPRLAQAIKAAEADQVVDLCSGAGGPWTWLHRTIANQTELKIGVCLTDKYPNIAAFQKVQQESGGAITYSAEPVDAARIPAQIAGFRTIFSSFHHFPPKEAAGVLQNAVNDRQGIGVFEAAARHPLNILLTFLAPVAALLITPFIRPFRWSRLFWTYVIPVIPFVLLVDGILSCLRAYSTTELSQLVSSLGAESYKWQIGKGAAGIVPVTYMVGHPEISALSIGGRLPESNAKSSIASTNSTGKRSADVLIAGGGIAGSSLAIMLGRKGFAVQLFERAQYPREKPCGEGLMPGGVAVLDHLNVTDSVGGTRFIGVRYHCNGRTVEGNFPRQAGYGQTGIGQRRRVLDHVLYSEAAATPGVRIHTGSRVEGPVVENGRVRGLIVEGKRMLAPLVVGADGMHSTIRQKLGLSSPPRRGRFGIRAHFRLLERREQSDRVEIFVAKGKEIYVTPLPDHEINVIALGEAGTYRADAKVSLLQRCEEFPELASLMEGAEQVSATIGASPLTGRAIAGVTPGAVLLGDAAGFVDPVTGGGMTQALMAAELLAGYIADNELSEDAWLWSFERERRKMLRGYVLLTQAILRLSDKPQL
ncbi:MAG TPA: NAD(P)/FAD-dependent oxidoreductase, partial [Candidatus Acidoferrales bacterium]